MFVAIQPEPSSLGRTSVRQVSASFMGRTTREISPSWQASVSMTDQDNVCHSGTLLKKFNVCQKLIFSTTGVVYHIIDVNEFAASLLAKREQGIGHQGNDFRSAESTSNWVAQLSEQLQ